MCAAGMRGGRAGGARGRAGVRSAALECALMRARNNDGERAQQRARGEEGGLEMEEGWGVESWPAKD